MQFDRAGGILLHVSSLPSPYGIGDLGPEAYRFLDFLSDAGQRIWQVLPLVPVDRGGSPYSSSSTFAGNPLFISPDLLHEEGLIEAHDLEAARLPDDAEALDTVDYVAAAKLKYGLVERAAGLLHEKRFEHHLLRFDTYRAEQAYWLEDYALFASIKEAEGGRAWTEWPEHLAKREEEALEEARGRLAARIEVHAFGQYLFETQWKRLHAYAEGLGIQIFGDLPIYVAHDSADVWGHSELFHLRRDGKPSVVAGVPPDYFSETGQRWGNPLYRWDRMAANGYRWWVQRFGRCFEFLDMLRIDHFRAFQAYWEISAEEETAIHGRWVPGPGAAVFHAVEQQLGALPIVAEDLGIITPDVTELMESLHIPGMAVLHFAFGGSADSTYLPHNYRQNLVAYTGTHDNDTTVGWWSLRKTAPPDSLEEHEYHFARQYLGIDDDREVHWKFIRWLMASVARVVVYPLQDVLGLGSAARMNVPGKNEGNWRWRVRPNAYGTQHAEILRAMAEAYSRI